MRRPLVLARAAEIRRDSKRRVQRVPTPRADRSRARPQPRSPARPPSLPAVHAAAAARASACERSSDSWLTGAWACASSGTSLSCASGRSREHGLATDGSPGSARPRLSSGGRSLRFNHLRWRHHASASGKMFSSWRTLPGKLKPSSQVQRSIRNALGLYAQLLGALLQEVARQHGARLPCRSRRAGRRRRITFRRWNKSSRNTPSLTRCSRFW